ncbi:Molybdate transporter 1 [Forsythia ovata]|uniref:Molybdate transporter 1 n=1 Tax=Forsythia ovata TaxID=205694 RepID=A0ABD1RPV8_9LAMI
MAELILNDPIPDATPCCHGAGGIAGQYKFGGMSGWCVALLDVAKLVLGLDSSLVKILDQFSVGVLGVLLLFVGIELAMCSRDMNSKEESVVMLICTLRSPLKTHKPSTEDTKSKLSDK